MRAQMNAAMSEARKPLTRAIGMLCCMWSSRIRRSYLTGSMAPDGPVASSLSGVIEYSLILWISFLGRSGGSTYDIPLWRDIQANRIDNLSIRALTALVATEIRFLTGTELANCA